METNMANEAKTDRIIWFSMWFLGSIASFGIAFFPLFYFSMDRRNQHFKRQVEFEKQAATFFKREWLPDVVPERNAKFWAASIILVLPVFAIVYFLTKDLIQHEKRQREFLEIVYPEWDHAPQNISIRNCALITAATLGFGVVYWLYKVVNIYNNHFKEQHHIEHEILTLMETKRNVESV